MTVSMRPFIPDSLPLPDHLEPYNKELNSLIGLVYEVDAIRCRLDYTGWSVDNRLFHRITQEQITSDALQEICQYIEASYEMEEDRLRLREGAQSLNCPLYRLGCRDQLLFFTIAGIVVGGMFYQTNIGLAITGFVIGGIALCLFGSMFTIVTCNKSCKKRAFQKLKAVKDFALENRSQYRNIGQWYDAYEQDRKQEKFIIGTELV